MKTNGTPVTDYLKSWPQYLLPGHLLSRIMQGITRIRYRPFKNALIDWLVRNYGVNMDEAVQSDPHGYDHVNAFFTRALKPEARAIADGPYDIACPVDGAVSQAGRIEEGRIFQAKGHDFGLLELLGGSEQRAAPFQGGSFATLYLSPRDYHRIHMPLDGTLTEMVHIPGRLFSVNAVTTRMVPGLFARNERVAALFDTAAGPMAVVMVGAIFVGSIETVWSGVVTPPAGRVVRRWRYDKGGEPTRFARGDEIGRFNMGSTVILLFGPQAIDWTSGVIPDTAVRLGQRLATRRIARPATPE